MRLLSISNQLFKNPCNQSEFFINFLIKTFATSHTAFYIFCLHPSKFQFFEFFIINRIFSCKFNYLISSTAKMIKIHFLLIPLNNKIPVLLNQFHMINLFSSHFIIWTYIKNFNSNLLFIEWKEKMKKIHSEKSFV